ncbi:MAG: ABC transporter ATP-binding protein [Chloroflexi bacterium]|nr:ABC transporter ATP-binding protein [Chloroflexota bacterium]
MAAEAVPVLEIDGLRTQFPTKEGVVRAVNGVSLQLRAGQVLGIVGESGSGKTVTALSILRLVPYPGQIVGGRVLFQGRDILAMNDDDLRHLRGSDISIVFQDAAHGLNPVLRIGDQIEELLTSHLPIKKKQARAMAVEALRKVGMPDPERAADRYTYQLSGGMSQRVMLAIAMALDPKVLIADEPTSNLDVTLQAQMLDQVRRMKERSGTSVILISHDLGVMAQMADEIAVMYGGYIVERAPKKVLFDKPLHPYTWALMRAVPRIDAPDKDLQALRGAPPDLMNLGEQCPFISRCNKALAMCRTKPMPALAEVEPGHWLACYNPIRYDWA